jgi:hypothetical protein
MAPAVATAAVALRLIVVGGGVGEAKVGADDGALATPIMLPS